MRLKFTVIIAATILAASLPNFAQNSNIVQTNKTKYSTNVKFSPKTTLKQRKRESVNNPKETKTNAIDESFESWPPTGWTLDPTSGDGVWEQGDGSYYGPGGANIYDGFFAAMFSNYDYTEGVKGSLITPQFDISSYLNPYISFYWWNDDGSNSPAKLTIYSSTDGSTFTEIETIETYGSGSTSWVHYTHSISASDKYIKITATSDWGTKNTYVDKFEVYEGPTPPVFTIDPESKDYGTLNFNESSSQTFTISNTGGTTLTISTAPTITGTNPADFTITDNNSYPKDLVTNEIITLDVAFSPKAEGSRSANLHIEDNTKGTHDIPLSGTGHNPTVTPPVTEDFSSYLPTDWSEGTGTLAAPSSISGTSSEWGPDDYRNDEESSNGKAARIEIQQDNLKDWLFSLPIYLGDGTTHYQLELDLALTDWDNSGAPSSPPDNDDKFAIIISTDNGRTWSSANSLQTWTNSTNPKLSEIPSEGEHLVYDLTSYTDTIKIGFYGETTTTGSDFEIFVDNFYIREKPTSPVFSVSPDSKNFGFQAINTTSGTQTFTVTNTGGGTMQITGTSLSGANTSEFTLTDNNTYPVNLNGNESISVDVKFEPTTNVSKSASLDFVSDTKTTHSVSLSGRGKNINHDGDGTIFGGYYYANSTSSGGSYRPAFNWIDPVDNSHTKITSWTYTNIGVTEGDDSYFDATIPFTFTFFGNDYTHAYINSNGAIEFTKPSIVYTGSDLSIPSTDLPDNFIAGCMMDLDDRSLGSVYYGTDADGNFVVTWRHYHDLDDDTEYITFQIILMKNGNIKIQYNYDQSALESASSSTTINGDALIGIENSDGSDGLQYRNNGVDGPIFDPGKAGNLALEISKTESATPVEITSFTATVEEDAAVQLNWVTATEENNYGFQVERSSSPGNTPVRTWATIGFVEGAGNSNSPKTYSYTDNVNASGKYSYRLKQIDLDGTFKYSKSIEVNIGFPTKFKLMQNFPNPFSKGADGNPITTIKYSIPKIYDEGKQTSVSAEDFASLRVYNILGEEVATLVNKKQSPGNYSVKFNASNLPSGIYFYQLQVGNFVATKKMILMK